MTLPKSNNKKEYDLISVSHYFPPRVGGLENMAFTLLKELSRKEIKSITIFGSNDIYEKEEDGFKKISLKPLNIFENTYPIFGFRFFFRTFKTIKNNPNAKIIIHSRHFTSSLITHLICELLSRPYTVIEHNAGRVYMRSKFSTKIINWLDRHVFGYVLSGAHQIIAVSKTGKRWISNNFGIPRDLISVIYNSYDVTNSSFDLEKKENIIVWASKWIEVKNPQLVLKAYIKLAQQHPTWLFMLIGQGSALEHENENLPENIKVIEQFLKQKEFISLLEKSKIYINSSFSEGLAIANLEALSMGNVPVFSDAPSNKEIAKRIETQSLIFKRNNIQDLVNKLEKAISKSEDKRFVKNIMTLSKKYFSKEQMIEQYHRMLLPEHYRNEDIKTISIVIPVYNEEKTISKILKKVITLKFPKRINKEVVIVDDASSDKSLDFVNEITKRKYNNTSFVVLRNKKNSGKSQTVKKGVIASSGDFVVVQDADLEYDPRDLIKFIEIFLSKPHLDVIYGNRFHKKNKFSSPVHSLGNRFVTYMSNFFTRPKGFAPNDMETCYKMVRGDLMRAIFRTLESNSNFGLEPEFTAKLAKYRKFNGKRLNFKEIDIYYKPRDISEGKKMRWFKHGFEALLEILYFNTNPFVIAEEYRGRKIKRKF
jgi:glycosyltransferase involved in cell wall biosynthesis